jgi:hypothetical protein
MGARVDFLAPADSSGPATATPGPGQVRFRLPASAVRETGGRSVVWLVREGRLQTREVEAGPVSGGFREIGRGLSGGERVVTGGVEEPKEGMRVKVESR